MLDYIPPYWTRDAMSAQAQYVQIPEITKSYEKVNVPAGQQVSPSTSLRTLYAIANASMRALTRSPDGPN